MMKGFNLKYFYIILMLLTNAQLYAKFDKTNDIVTDSRTSLKWQDNYSDNANVIKKSSWTDAIDYCETKDEFGFDDWRLPNKNELFTIVDYTNIDPSIDKHFESNVSNYYWTSSTYPQDTAKAWAVYFKTGSITEAKKTNSYYVRCVRAGQNQ